MLSSMKYNYLKLELNVALIVLILHYVRGQDRRKQEKSSLVLICSLVHCPKLNIINCT